MSIINKGRLNKICKDWLQPIFLAVIMFAIFSIFFFNAKVDGPSMLPTLKHGNRLITLKTNFVKEFNHGDIIVVDSQGLGILIIKRIIALPGETIKIEDGKVYVNDVLIEESYILNETLEELIITMKENQYFVMGDNRQNSMDSRFEIVGPITKEKIKGKIIFSIFPPKLMEEV